MTTTTQEREHVTLPGVPDPAVIGIFGPGELAAIGILEAVPILEVSWHDERTGCATAHRYLGGELQGIPSDYTGCYFYHSGRCDMNGRRSSPCLFHEPESGRSWDKVRWWCLLEYPDGRTAITPRHSAAQIAQMDGARVIGWEVTP